MIIVPKHKHDSIQQGDHPRSLLVFQYNEKALCVYQKLQKEITLQWLDQKA